MYSYEDTRPLPQGPPAPLDSLQRADSPTQATHYPEVPNGEGAWERQPCALGFSVIAATTSSSWGGAGVRW